MFYCLESQQPGNCIVHVLLKLEGLFKTVCDSSSEDWVGMDISIEVLNKANVWKLFGCILIGNLATIQLSLILPSRQISSSTWVKHKGSAAAAVAASFAATVAAAAVAAAQSLISSVECSTLVLMDNSSQKVEVSNLGLLSWLHVEFQNSAKRLHCVQCTM